MARSSSPSRTTAACAIDEIDASFLESLIGYNARRAALAAIDRFLDGMAPFQLKPVDFSVLSLIHHNPGITSRQLCASLGLLPPNLVGMLNALEKRELLLRMPHPRDGRAMGLHLTAGGEKLMRDAEKTAATLEAQVGAHLSPGEVQTLIRLLKRVYQAQEPRL